MGLNDSISMAIINDKPTIAMEDSLRTAINKMVENKSTALAVKSGDELVGIVTEMDLMDCMSRNEDLDQTKANYCMTACELITQERTQTPCIQLAEDESVKFGLNLMAHAGVHHLLISGADDKAVGIVSSIDLLKVAIS